MIVVKCAIHFHILSKICLKSYERIYFFFSNCGLRSAEGQGEHERVFFEERQKFGDIQQKGT